MSTQNQFMTNKIKSPYASLLFLLVFLICYFLFGEWQKNSANSQKVTATPEFCKVIEKPIIADSNPPQCKFDARLIRPPFSSDYLLWIKTEKGVVEHRVPLQQIISAEVK